MELYKITDALAKLEDMAEDDAALLPYLEGVQLQLNEKVDNIVRFKRNMESEADAIGAEIERLKALRASRERVADKLQDYLAYCMMKNGIERIDTPIAKLSFRKSEYVDVVDDRLIPDAFKKTVLTTQVDKVALKKAMKDGLEVQGAKIEERRSLHVK